VNQRYSCLPELSKQRQSGISALHTDVIRVLEQTLTVGVIEQNAEFIVHPTPPTITPEIIITAATVTLTMLAVVIVKIRQQNALRR